MLVSNRPIYLSRPLAAVFCGMLAATSFLASAPANAAAKETCGTPVTDPTLNVSAPDMPRPRLGDEAIDPELGGCVVRVSDNGTLGTSESVPIYAQLQAWNADQSLILLNSGHIVDAETYRVVHTVNIRWPGYGEGIRWSPVDPDVLYYTGGLSPGGGGDGVSCGVDSARFMRYRLTNGGRSGRSELVGCFSEYANFQRDVSYEDLSDDGRYVALMGISADGKYELFAYDVIDRRKGAVLEVPDPAAVDWAAVTPSGKYVVVQFGNGYARFWGMEAFERKTMDYAGKVNLTTGHGDLMMDAQGNEYMVQTNASNAWLLGDDHVIIRSRIPNGIVFDSAGNPDEAATVASGATVPLLTLHWESAVHISCRNTDAPGWCVVSTFGGPQAPFSEEVFKLYLDSTPRSPRVQRLAHHRSDWDCSYWAQPHATVRQDGKQVIFGSSRSQECSPEAYIINGTGGGAALGVSAAPTGFSVE